MAIRLGVAGLSPLPQQMRSLRTPRRNGKSALHCPGASLGGGKYKGYGISNRLLGHVLVRDRLRGEDWYAPRTHWSDVASIGAIGFPAEYNYLAPALEDYLITILNQPKNKKKNKRAKAPPVLSEVD